MRRSTPATPADGRAETILLYGRHAVAAALANPDRPCRRLLVTDNAAKALGEAAARREIATERVSARDIDRLLATDAVHQGCCLEAGPLPERGLLSLLEAGPARALFLALDQVEDPRNLGAVLRSAAAFGVYAVLLPRHGSASLNGACAKAASGALDMLPIIALANLGQGLAQLRQHGFWSIGLDGAATGVLTAAPDFEKCVLVIGAEGKGLRRLTQEACDVTARIEIDDRMESLNVAVAAGIALHHLRHRGSGTAP